MHRLAGKNMIISCPNILVGWTANQKGRFSVFLLLVENSFLTWNHALLHLCLCGMNYRNDGSVQVQIQLIPCSFLLAQGKENCGRRKSFRRSTIWALHSFFFSVSHLHLQYQGQQCIRNSSSFIIVMSLRLSIRLEYQLCIQFLLFQCSNFLLDFCAQTLALMPRHSSVAWRPLHALQPQ